MSVQTKLIALVLIVLISACEKDKKIIEGAEPTPAVSNPPANFRIIDSTDTQITRTAYSTNQNVSSSIDLNGDQVADIRLNVIYAHGASGIKIHDTKIETLNNTTFVLCDSGYVNEYVDSCNLTTMTVKINENFPKALFYKDSLKTSSRWRTGNFHLTHYEEVWQNISSPAACYQSIKSQNWPDAQWRYIGVKVNGRFGWLKMYSNGNRFNTFSEFALGL